MSQLSTPSVLWTAGKCVPPSLPLSSDSVAYACSRFRSLMHSTDALNRLQTLFRSYYRFGDVHLAFAKLLSACQHQVSEILVHKFNDRFESPSYAIGTSAKQTRRILMLARRCQKYEDRRLLEVTAPADLTEAVYLRAQCKP